MNKPKDWWGDPQNAKEWIKQNQKREKEKGINTTKESENIVIKEISKRKDFKNILEVGAGDGRLIGSLSTRKTLTCSSIDINKELSKYVSKKYPRVNTKVGNIINLPYKDNEFDLVFTYQVLQHVHPDDIEQAIKELKRVAKEVWCWEGIGRVDYKHGDQTHKAHNGSWVWHLDKITKCYSITTPKNNKITLDRQRLYKIK